MSVLHAIEDWRREQIRRGYWPLLNDEPMPYRLGLNEARAFLDEVGQMSIVMGGPGEFHVRTMSDEDLVRRMANVHYMDVPLEVAR